MAEVIVQRENIKHPLTTAQILSIVVSEEVSGKTVSLFVKLLEGRRKGQIREAFWCENVLGASGNNNLDTFAAWSGNAFTWEALDPAKLPLGSYDPDEFSPNEDVRLVGMYRFVDSTPGVDNPRWKVAAASRKSSNGKHILIPATTE